MTTLALVPAPRSVIEDAAAAPLPISGATTVSGESDAAREFARLVGARTGDTPRFADDGHVRFVIAAGGQPESYRIAVDAASALVSAPDAAGLFYGAHTLSQLLRRGADGWAIPAVVIDDAPRFAYRGAMLDVARHFFPLPVVKGYVDRIAALKFNHLHLHLSDDQGWRIHLDARPELTAKASSSAALGDPGGFYSRSDYAELVAYAASRHVTIVPEIDLPGHTHAVGLAYPELAAEPVLSEQIRADAAEFGGGLPTPGEPYTGFAVGFSSLRIDDERTYDFLADVFGELAEMTPGPYLHLGGDEALGTSPADYGRIVSRALEIVRATGKTPIAWHEAGAALELPPGMVAQYWGYVEPEDAQADAARAVVAAGGRVILSPADRAYLDMKPDADAVLGLTWAKGPTSLADAYGWDPDAVLDGVAESDILGVEAPLWTETIRTAADIDEMAFPRAAAVAEIAWTAADAPLRGWESFRARLSGLGPVWTAAGVGFSRLPEIEWTDA